MGLCRNPGYILLFMKTCKKCLVEHADSFFYKKCGYTCKTCHKARVSENNRTDEYRKKISEHKKERYISRYKEERSVPRLIAAETRRRKSEAALPGRIAKQKQYLEEYRNNNRDKIRAYTRSPEYREKRNAKKRERELNDPLFKIRNRLGARISKAVRANRGVKRARTIELIGCSVTFLKRHLERLFTDGMNWDNFGRGDKVWHIDHILPCDLFNLADEDQQKACFHYTNLQPLWGVDNVIKSNKLPAKPRCSG